MSEAKHTPGPLTVSVNDKWPFKIVTKNAEGEVVFQTDLPIYSTSHNCAADAIYGVGLPAEWNSAEMNARAIADEVVRAAAPDLLAALQGILGYFDSGNSVSVSQATIKASSDEVKAARAPIAKATGGAA